MGSIELIPDLTERVTAATDFMMAIVGVFGVLQMRRNQPASPFKINLWTAVYLLFIIAAMLGTVLHGFVLSPGNYNLCWLGVLLSLGLMVSLFVVGFVNDLFGRVAASNLLPVMIVAGVGFFGFSWANGQDFSLFLMYESLGLLAALSGYLYLAFRRIPGASAMATGVFITILAAIVQATRALSFTVIVPFDHNAVYHLIQIAGVLFLTRGIVQSTSLQTGT
ncbi:MAG: hypothetical protein O2780_01000 [Proteobacteria bacterium]|jgi:hypothetical protein|nr:hypothetical protein [Pseudomonadota bacterium]MDA1300405.1 hypothetical protein [Pseudomonadota bacterium]